MNEFLLSVDEPHVATAPKVFAFTNVRFHAADSVIMPSRLIGTARSGDLFVVQLYPDMQYPRYLYTIESVTGPEDNRGIAEGYTMVRLKLISQSEKIYGKHLEEWQ